MTESIFDADELEREKGVILQEIGAVEDTPDDLVFDLFNASAFPDQPIGRPILGTPEQIARFSRDSIGGYLESHYSSGATVFGAAGAIEHERICDEVERRFAGFPPAAPVSAEPAARYLGGELRLSGGSNKPISSSASRGSPTPTTISTRFRCSPMRSAAACPRACSRRCARRAASPTPSTPSTGAFRTPASLASMRRPARKTSRELMPVALDCLGEAAQDLSEAEARRAKAQMKVSLLAALESPSPRCEQIARQVMAFGRVLSRAEIIAMIDGLDIAHIRAAGARALALGADGRRHRAGRQGFEPGPRRANVCAPC